MAEIEHIETGAAPNDGQGDPLRTAFEKINRNFSKLDDRAQVLPPADSTGKVGDLPGMYAYDENFFYYCHGEYDGTSFIWARIAGSNF